jgi:hypothetical protein
MTHLVVVRTFRTQARAEAALEPLARAVSGADARIVFLGPGRRPWAVALAAEAVDALMASSEVR